MLYGFSLFASSLLAALPLTTFAQTTPVAAAPQAVTVMTGPVGNAGNGAAATPVPAAPLSVTSSLVASAGVVPPVGGSNVSTSAAPAAAASTAGVIGNGQVAVWVVKVGGTKNELVFSPNSVTAKVGEMVQFQFYSKVCITTEYSRFSNAQADTLLSESLGSSRGLCIAVYATAICQQRLLQRIHAHGQRGTTYLYDTNPRYKSDLVLLLTSKALPRGHGGRYQPVSQSSLPSTASTLLPIPPSATPEIYERKTEECAISPATGQTLADFTSRAAQAPANVSPQMPAAAAPAAGGEGQLGGTTATPASTDPAAAPAATATTSAAGKVVRSSWALSLIVVAALFVIQG